VPDLSRLVLPIEADHLPAGSIDLGPQNFSPCLNEIRCFGSAELGLLALLDHRRDLPPEIDLGVHKPVDSVVHDLIDLLCSVGYDLSLERATRTLGIEKVDNLAQADVLF